MDSEQRPGIHIYENPLPEFTPKLLRAIGSSAVHLLQRFENSSGDLLLDEWLCDTSLSDAELPDIDQEAFLEWQRASTGWIPKKVLDWWLPKFDTEPNLEPMPLGWWYRRARIIATAEIEETVVAAGALTAVVGNGIQGTAGRMYKDLFFEIRATVVEEAWRGQGLFTDVVERLLAKAREAGRLPTCLVTDNEALKRVIRRQQFTAPAVVNQSTLCEVLCWCSNKPWLDPCEACPVSPGRAMWWETDRPLPPGEDKDRFDYQSGPVAVSSWVGQTEENSRAEELSTSAYSQGIPSVSQSE